MVSSSVHMVTDMTSEHERTIWLFSSRCDVHVLLFSSLSFRILIHWTFLPINFNFPSYAWMSEHVAHLNLERKRELWTLQGTTPTEAQHHWRMSPTAAHSLLAAGIQLELNCAWWIPPLLVHQFPSVQNMAIYFWGHEKRDRKTKIQ